MTSSSCKPDHESVFRQIDSKLKTQLTRPWRDPARFLSRVKSLAAIAVAVIIAGHPFVANATTGFYELTGNNNPLNMVSGEIASTPAFVDIDNDGDMDAFIGSTDGTIRFYENQGTPEVPSFMEMSNSNPFDGVDVGGFSAPVFVDIDNDGDMDAFIGFRKYNGGLSFSYSNGIKYYENTSYTDTDSTYVVQFTIASDDDNPLDIDMNGEYLKPTFADIDGDRDMDAFIGRSAGTIKFLRNTSYTDTDSNYVVQFEEADEDTNPNPFSGVDVGDYSAPALVDIDGDGDLDAFIGELNGSINYFENQGTESTPVFVEIDDENNPFYDKAVATSSAPAFVDIDNDGDMDVFIGNSLGTINYFRNISGSSLIQFSSMTYTVNEDDGEATITVTRSGETEEAVSVNYTVSDGTAIDGEDYTAGTGTLEWADGDSEAKTFTVSITNDDTSEDDETIYLQLSDASGVAAFLGFFDNAVLTVEDDDYSCKLQFSSATYTVNENATEASATITVTRADGSDGEVSVNYSALTETATAGEDFTAASGTLTWADGDTEDKTFTVSIVDDTLDEYDETISLELSDYTGYSIAGDNDTATLTIVDDEGPGNLQFSETEFTVDEDEGTATITVSRTDGSAGEVSVTYTTVAGTAVTDEDYETTTGTLTWTDGDSEDKTFTINITDDSVDESDETLSIELSDPTGGSGLGLNDSAILTIADDEGPGNFKFSDTEYSVDETEGTKTITVTRADGSAGAVSVEFLSHGDTATEGSDYKNASGTLSWADGESGDKTFSVSIVNDELDEDAETLDLSLTNPSGGGTLKSDSTAVLTIIDDDTSDGDACFIQATGTDTGWMKKIWRKLLLLF